MYIIYINRLRIRQLRLRLRFLAITSSDISSPPQDPMFEEQGYREEAVGIEDIKALSASAFANKTVCVLVRLDEKLRNAPFRI